MSPAGTRVLAAAALALALGAGRAAAQSGADAPDLDPNAHYRVAPSFAEGNHVSSVFVYLRNPSGDEKTDAGSRYEVEKTFGIRAGGGFNSYQTDAALAAVKHLPWVKDAEVRLYSTTGGGEVTVAVLVTLLGAEPKPAPPVTGTLVTGSLGALPVLWRDDREGLLKLIVNPSSGFYVDRDPWIGNPGAFVGNPGTERTLTHFEWGLELGIGGVTRLGRSPVYLFGSASYVFSGTLGLDVYSTESSRGHGEMEDLYGGVLVKPAGSSSSFKLSAGRQKFSLNRNFLMGHVLGATNAGDRGATDLSPRNAYDLVVDAQWQADRFSVRGFFARANELDASDTKTEYAGLNLTYADGPVDASLALIGIPSSKATYLVPGGSALPREGLRAVNPRVRWKAPLGVEGLWLEAEWAHEWNTNHSMSADGWGVWAGYTFTKAPGRPGLLYRYSVFTGDDPSTPTYERFDTMTGGVQRDWLLGMTMTQVARGRNLRVHRFEASVRPRTGMDLSVDCYDYSADELNNLGGQRALPTYASSHLGNEVTPTLQWMVNKNLYVQALASYLIPGPGLRDSLPAPTHVWQAYKLSFYWFF